MRKCSNCPAVVFFPPGQLHSVLTYFVGLEALVLCEVVIISGKYWNWGEHCLDWCSEGKSVTGSGKSGLVGLFFLLCHVKHPVSAGKHWSGVPVGHWALGDVFKVLYQGCFPCTVWDLPGELFVWGTEAQANPWSTRGLEKISFVPL